MTLKKSLFIGIIVLFLILNSFSVIAQNLEIQKQTISDVIIKEFENPAKFTISITNLGETGDFQLYSFTGFNMFPEEEFTIGTGNTKTLNVEVTPQYSVKKYDGYYTFTYNIISKTTETVEDKLRVRLVALEDAFVVGAENIDPNSNSVNIYLKNKEDYEFGLIDVEFSSAFFELNKQVDMGPLEKKQFNVELNADEYRKLLAGYYTISADIKTGNYSAEIDSVIKFVEKEDIVVNEKNYGFIIFEKVITKENQGNIPSTSETVVRKNIITRLFTFVTPEPTLVERDGFDIYYTWEKQIQPGEEFVIRVKTNYLFPLILIIFIIAIAVLAKQYSSTHLILTKKTQFVKSKGGEFALKVIVDVRAKKYVEKISIIDKYPSLLKLHNKFSEEPSRIDEKNRRLEWNIDHMAAGERRRFSYIIYSKVGVVGTFALPKANAVYEKEGDIHESDSNRAFFVAESKGDKI